MGPKQASRPRQPSRHARAVTVEDSDSSRVPVAEIGDHSGSTDAASTSSHRGAGLTTQRIQRLESLKKRPVGGGNPVPLNPDGSTPKPILKHMPKAVLRKSKAEREALEKLEAERLRERIADVVATRKQDSSKTTVDPDRRRGRGRGGAWVTAPRRAGASGPLGEGAVAVGWTTRGGGRAVHRTRTTYGKGTRSDVKREITVKVKAEVGTVYGDGIPLRTDQEDLGEEELDDRLNIDMINLISSDSEAGDGGDSLGKGKGKAAARLQTLASRPARGLRPVRVEREAHVDRVVNVNTEASSSKSAELRRQAKEKGHAAASEKIHVDDEGEEEEDEFSEDQNEDDIIVKGSKAAPPGSDSRILEDDIILKDEPVETGTGVPREIPTVTDAASAIKLQNTLTKKKQDKGGISKARRVRKQLQTEEERQEWDRYDRDLDYVKLVLASTKSADAGPTTTAPAPDVEATSTEPQGSTSKLATVDDERQGRLFLIQFPPMTPNLIDPSTVQIDDQNDADTVEEVAPPQPRLLHIPPADRGDGSNISAIKKESNDTNMSAIPADAAAQPSTSDPADASTSGSAGVSRLITAANTRLPPGRVGKLQVHQSGRATLDWGKIKFQLNHGSEAGFLQDAIIASEAKYGASADDAGAGGGDNVAADYVERKVWAMSQVNGKFIATPDWDSLLQG